MQDVSCQGGETFKIWKSERGYKVISDNEEFKSNLNFMELLVGDELSKSEIVSEKRPHYPITVLKENKNSSARTYEAQGAGCCNIKTTKSRPPFILSCCALSSRRSSEK